MRNFRYFFREGVGNMLSHGFMSFAAIGVTVACLLIMGTFSLVAYNANINLQDLQKENAVVAFVDESLTDEEAQGLQSQLSGISGVADCTFVSRQEARDEYVAQYNEDDLYSDLDPTIFRHRYVMHLTDLKLMDQVVQQLDETEGIAKVRADQDISNGFITVRNIASVISIALIAILLIISVFIISNTIKLTTFDRRDEIAIMKWWGLPMASSAGPSCMRACYWDSSARQWPSGSSGCCMPPYPRASPIPTPCSCCGWWTSVRSGPRWRRYSPAWASWWAWAAA